MTYPVEGRSCGGDNRFGTQSNTGECCSEPLVIYGAQYEQ